MNRILFLKAGFVPLGSKASCSKSFEEGPMHPACHNLLVLPVLQTRVIFYNALLIDNLLVGLDCPEWSVLLLNKMVGLEYRIDLVNYIQLSDPDPCSLFKASIRPK